MGMTIDEHKEHLLDIMDSMPDDACGDWRDSLAYAIDTMRKYQQLQADYENRLKADMVAMLEEFDLELSEYEDADLIRVEYIRQDIQEKINALKGEENVDTDTE